MLAWTLVMARGFSHFTMDGEGKEHELCCVLCFVGRDEMFWPRAAAAAAATADGREITKAKFLHT